MTDSDKVTEIIFKIAFAIVWVVYIAIRAPFESRHKQIEKIKSSDTPGGKFLLLLLAFGLMIIPLVWLFTGFLDHFNASFPEWLRGIGIAIAIASLVYFRNIHKALGTNWSPTLEITKNHELIKTGPYKKIRHPMYTQIWIWTIAQALIISNLVAGFSGIIAWGIVYFIRIPKEEKMMVEHFGKEYLGYMKQTGRILPFRKMRP